ncbi:MAG: T9SS type A sorting domain-containing protein [Bacteroidales bacterium]|nr:T9SS type A sorting domain-containing protein [Bacteroidales bacterium]MCF8388522.1 T9SS type A sorting domain-containing protein [Bacteroidales bacterium]MCF8399532.1 T9SS type A sorting domain-containing protein [Bacteroidales bacterium]
MRNFTFILAGFIILCSSPIALKSQNLYLMENSGQQTDYVIDNLNKLYFSSGELMVELQNGAIDQYPLNDIRYLGFGGPLKTPPPFITEKMGMNLYPNPVSGTMHIQYHMHGTQTVRIEIISIDGRMFHSERLFSENQMSVWQVRLETIPAGLYVCRMISGKNIITKKFIKN